jgi:glycosyltransferase involved in cell wall biosynthesis
VIEAPLLSQSAASGVSVQVCVIVPAYNAERYLLETVRSILDQSFADLVLLIVDDGSTDGTLALARSIADPRVSVLTGPNHGRAHARNRGMQEWPSSEFVAYLDADDLWDPDKLDTQIAELRARPELVAVGSFMRYISSSGKVLGETGQIIGQAEHQALQRGELSPFPVGSCIMVRRTVVDRMNGFDPELREGEDLEFLSRLSRLGPIGCVPRALGSYRIHPESAMARNRAGINLYSRFVRARIAARDAGSDLAWDQFRQAYRPTFAQRYRDRVEIWYRSAALWLGEGRPLRALGYGVLAGVASPRYTLRRLYRQRLKR